MRIQPTVQQGVPCPSLAPAFDDICSTADENELLFALAKWSDIHFEEPTNLTSWVLVLNRIDALLGDIIDRSGPLLLLPDTREAVQVQAAAAVLKEQCAFDTHAIIIILRFLSLLLLNATNKDIYNSVERLMTLLKAYDDDISRLALETTLSLVTPPPTQRCLNFTNHVTLMHKNAGLCLPLFQIVEFGRRSICSQRAVDLLSPAFNVAEQEQDLMFTMVSKSRHSQAPHPLPNDGSKGDGGSGDHDGRSLVLPDFLSAANGVNAAIDSAGARLQSAILQETWFPMENAFPLLCQMRSMRALSSITGRQGALRRIYQAILILLCCHPSSATLSDFFHDKTEILQDFIYMLRSGPGTPEYNAAIPFDLRVLACQSLVAVVGSRDVSSISVMGRFSWLQHDLGVNRGQYMGLLPCLLRSAASFLATRHANTCDYAVEITLADDGDGSGSASKQHVQSWLERVAVVAADTTDSSTALSELIVQTPPTGLMKVANVDKIKSNMKCVYPAGSAVTAATLRVWILAAQQASPIFSSDGHVQYSWTYLTRLLWTEQILILTTAIISATSALPALVDSGFIALMVGTVADLAVRDHTDLHLSYIEATMIQMLELSISDSTSSMNIFKEMDGVETLLERLLYEINDGRFKGTTTADASNSSLLEASSSDGTTSSSSGSKRKYSEVEPPPPSSGRSTRSKSTPIKATSSSSSTAIVAPETSLPRVIKNVPQVYVEQENDLAERVRGGAHTMLPSTNVVIHSLLSVLSIYLQEGADSRLSHVLRGKKFTSVMSILFQNSRYLASPVFAFAYSIFSEVINNDPGFLGFIITNGIVKQALECCKYIDQDCPSGHKGKASADSATIDVLGLPDRALLNDVLFRRDARSALCWPEMTAELIGAITSFISAVALTKDGLELITKVNPFTPIFKSFLDFRCYAPFSNTMMNDLPRSIGASMEDLVRHYPMLADQCMHALFCTMEIVCDMSSEEEVSTFESITPSGVSYLVYLHMTTGLLQCLNQLLVRPPCVEYFFKDNRGVPLLVKLLKVGMSASRSFLAALAASTEPTTNSLGHHPIVKCVAQCIMSVCQHEPKKLSEQLFLLLRSESESLDHSLDVYWETYGTEANEIMLEDRVICCDGKKLKNFLDSVSRKRLHKCCEQGELPPVLKQFTEVLRHFVVLNYLVENLASVLNMLSSRAQSRYSTTSSNPLVSVQDCETLDNIINKIYVASQEELCAARGNLITGNKRGKPKAHPLYRLLIISHEHVVVRGSADGDSGKKVCKLPKGSIVDAYERSTGSDNALKYRIKEGWIGFYRNNSYGDPQVEVIELLEKSAEQLALDEVQTAASLDTPQKKFDFEKYANVSPRRGGFMTMFHFHCCVRHLLSVVSWSFLPAPGKPFPEQTFLLLPLIQSCLHNLLPDIDYTSKVGGLRPEHAAAVATTGSGAGSGVLDQYFIDSPFPSPESFSISDSFRTIHAVELCHHLLFDEKKGNGETNILLLIHLFHDGFIEKVMHASTLVFLTCLHPEQKPTPAPISCGSSSSSSVAMAVCTEDVSEDEDQSDVAGAVPPDEDDMASDCSSDADEDIKSDWHQKRILKERRMLAVTNIDIVTELWKLFFGNFSLSSRAATLLKDSADETHDFDMSLLRHKMYCLEVKYLFQAWSHPLLYTLPPTSVRHVLELVNVISKTFWGLTNDAPSSTSAGSRSIGGTGGSNRGRSRNLGSDGNGRPVFGGLQHDMSFSSMPLSLQQLLQRGGMNPSFDFPEFPLNATSGSVVDGNMEEGGEETSPGGLFRLEQLRGRPRSDSAHSLGSRGSSRRRSLSGSSAPVVPTTAPVFTEMSATHMTRLTHILPLSTKQTADELKAGKVLATELSRVIYKSMMMASLELVSRGIKAPGVQWRTEAALMNQSLTREDTTVMVLSMVTVALDITKWPEAVRSVVQLTAVLEPLMVILDRPLTTAAASRLYGLLHALVLVFTGSKFEFIFLLISRSPRYSKFMSLLVDHIERKQARLFSKTSTGTTVNSECMPDNAASLWLAPALLLLDSFVQPIVLDRKLMAQCLRDLSKFIDPIGVTKYGEELATLLPFSFIRGLVAEFGMPVEEKKSNFSMKRGSASNDLKLSSFIEKHGELAHDASVEDISTIKQSLPAAASSVVPEDVIKESSTSGDPVPTPVLVDGATPSHPLIENGLDSPLRVRCVHVCLQLLTLCRSPKDSVLAQSACQLLCHLSRERHLAELVHASRGIEKLLAVNCKFDGSSAFVYTLILQILEDDQYLQYSMESTIKVCLHRMKTSSSAKKNYTLKTFIEILAPLMYRNQTLFLEAVEKCCKISMSGGEYMVEAVADIDVHSGGSSSSGKNAAVVTEGGGAMGYNSIPKVRFSTPAAPASAAGVNLTPGASLNRAGTTPEPAMMKEMLEALVHKLLAQWLVALGKSKSTEPSSDEHNSRCLLSMADILTLLGDLVCTVPGFATCIHKCQFSPSSKQKASGSPHTQVFEAALSSMKHSLTGEPLHSTHFIAFLVHSLLSCHVILQQNTSNQSTASTTPALSSAGGGGVSSSSTGTATSTTDASTTVICGVDTKILKDSVCYLIVALVSRPGDGRRRVLKEVLGVLKLGGMSIDTTAKLKVVSSLIQCVQSVLNPKPAWKQRNLLTVPYKDIIITAISLKAYGILSEAFFAIECGHPMALQVSEQISGPLEFLIRKGLPMYDDHVSAERRGTTDGKTGDGSSELVKKSNDGTSSRKTGRHTYRTDTSPQITPHSTPSSSSAATVAAWSLERPPIGPAGALSSRSTSRHSQSSATVTPGAVGAASGGRSSLGGNHRADYDFFSPLVSATGNGAADRRDTMTTDDDRDMDRLEHHDTLENDLRLLSQPSHASDAMAMSTPGDHGHMMEVLGDDDDDDDDEDELDMDMDSILSSGSEDEEEEEEEDDEDGLYDEEDEDDDEDDDDDDIVVDDFGSDFEEEDEDHDSDDDDDGHSHDHDLDNVDMDGDMINSNNNNAMGAPSTNMEISISFQPQTANGDRAAPSIQGGSSAEFVEEASRLVAAAANANTNAGSGSRHHGDMRPPNRRLPAHTNVAGRSRGRHSSSSGPHTGRRAYESIFDQADMGNEEGMSGYDSAQDMYDDNREHDEHHSNVVRGGHDHEDDGGGGGSDSNGWVTVNHGGRDHDDDDDDGGGEDDDYLEDDMDDEIAAQMMHQSGRGSSGGVSGRGGRPRLPDIMESFYGQNGGHGGMGGGAVRIGGDDLMSFLGNLPIPDIIRDSIANNGGGQGGMRHMVAHMPINVEDGENNGQEMMMMMGGPGRGFPGGGMSNGVRDALQSLMRPQHRGAGGSQRTTVREGTTSNAAPSRHPLLDVSSAAGGGSGRMMTSRPRGGSFVDAIISSVDGSSGSSREGLSAAQTQEMKSITTQRRRLLGSLISERRWGTDVGDRDVSITGLNTIGQSVVNLYKSTAPGEEIVSSDVDTTASEGKKRPSFESAFLSQFSGGSGSRMGDQSRRVPHGFSFGDESKEETDLQETKEGDSDYSGDDGGEGMDDDEDEVDYDDDDDAGDDASDMDDVEDDGEVVDTVTVTGNSDNSGHAEADAGASSNTPSEPVAVLPIADSTTQTSAAELAGEVVDDPPSTSGDGAVVSAVVSTVVDATTISVREPVAPAAVAEPETPVVTAVSIPVAAPGGAVGNATTAASGVAAPSNSSGDSAIITTYGGDGQVIHACPDGYDPEIWAFLPVEVQLEVLGEQGDSSEETAMLAQTGLDRATLDALPAAMRSEVLREEVVERRRRESIDQTGTAESTDASGLVSAFGSQIGADLQNEDSSTRPSAAQENYLFITSLPPDLRQEAFLGADEEFISSLPQSIRDEANALRERHQIRLSSAPSRAPAVASAREGDSGNNENQSSMEPEEGATGEDGGDGTGSVYQRLYSQLLSGGREGGVRGGAQRGGDADAAEVVAQPTTVFFEDDRTTSPPFGPRLVSRILHYVVTGTSTRLSRVLTKLLCVLCRYQSSRLPILRALTSILLKDARKATEYLLQIPREPYKTHAVRCPQKNSTSSTPRLHQSPAVCKADPDESLLLEMTNVADGLARASQVEGTLCVRRLLHLISSLVKHSDRLVWYDVMNEAGRQVTSTPTASSSSSSSNSNIQVTVSNNSVVPAAVPEIKVKIDSSGSSEWMFESLISLLGDQRVIQECDIDSVLYLLGELCEPLSRLTVGQVNELVAKQRKMSTTSSEEKKVLVVMPELTRDTSKGNSAAASTAEEITPPLDDTIASTGIVRERDSAVEPPSKRRKVDTPTALGSSLPSETSADAGTTVSASSGDTGSATAVAVEHTSEEENAVSTATAGAAMDVVVVGPTLPATQDVTTNDGLALLSSEVEAASSSPSATPATSADADVAASENDDNKAVDLPFPVLSAASIELLAILSKSEYCGGPGRNRLSRIMCTLSLYDDNWKQLVSSLSTAAEGLIGSTEVECRVMLGVLTKVVDRNGSAADATSLPELSTPSSVSETRLLRVFRLMGSLRNSIDSTAANPAAGGAATNSDLAPMTLSGSIEERSFVAEHIRGINFGSLWQLLCQILDQIRGLEGINDEVIAVVGGGQSGTSSVSAQNVSLATSVSSANGTTVALSPKQPFLSSLTMRFMPLIECYLTVSGATLLRPRPAASQASEPGTGGPLRSLNSFVAIDGHSSFASMHPPTPTAAGSSSTTLRAASSIVQQKVSIPGARFRQHAAYQDMHMDMVDGQDAVRFLHFAEANKSLLNMILRQNIPLLESSFSPFVLIQRLRSLLHFDIKRAYFKLKLKKIKQNAGRSFGSLRLSVHRSSVMEDSFQKIRFCSADEMKKRISVTFLGEEGIDAGGLTREWFSLLAKEIFNVNYCLFTATHDNVTFQPNPYSGINPDHLGYFKFVGRIIGKAISDGHLLDAHFTRSFYKHMLGIPVGYQDLEALEPEYFKSLMTIVEHPLDMLGLELTFSAELNEFGRVEVVDLIENGRNVAVTDENKGDYIRLIANHRMTNSIQKQIDAFLEGFHDIIPPELISIFDAQELELIISGLPDIDLDDLRAHTDYQGYKATDPVINFFWSSLRSFSKEEKALFLQFVTGTSKVPLEGFKALYGARGPQQFNIHKAYGTHLLPCAHTCFNQLDLPEYITEEDLREKMLIALHEGAEGFGFA